MNALRTIVNTDGWGEATDLVTGNGNLLALRVGSKSAADIYIQLHETATALVGGETPSVSVPVAAGGYYETDTRFDFITGLVIAASSTKATYTALGADDVLISAQIDKAGL